MAAVNFTPVQTPYDICQVSVCGQSTSVGQASLPVSTTTQKYKNLKLKDISTQWAANTSYPTGSFVFPNPTTNRIYVNNGATFTSGPSQPSFDLTLGSSTPDNGGTWTCITTSSRGGYDYNGASSGPWLTAVPLIDLMRVAAAGDSAMGISIQGQDPATSFVEALSEILVFYKFAPFVLVATCIGQSGAPIATIGKEGALCYIWDTWETSFWKGYATGQGKSFGRITDIIWHGQANSDDPTYASEVYGTSSTGIIFPHQTDIPAITGQAGSISCWVLQQNSNPTATKWQTGFATTQQVLLPSVSGGLAILSGPEFCMPFAPTDAQHHSTPGTDQGAELMAWQFAWSSPWILNNGPWTSFTPTSVVGSAGNTVWTLTYNLPVGSPLAIDTTRTQPFQSGALAAFWKDVLGYAALDLPNVITAINVATNECTTLTPHGLTTGQSIFLTADVATGVTGLGGYSSITVTGPSTFTIDGATLTGSYTPNTAQYARLVKINSAVIVGTNQVQLTLAAAPGTGLEINYAYQIDLVAPGSFTCKRGGLIRDSWGVIGTKTGTVLYNRPPATRHTGLT